MLIPLLDNGHGGVIDGTYQTYGKRSPFRNGGLLYEGEFNRAIVSRITEVLANKGIPYVRICPEDTDIPLSIRVNRANKYDPSKYYLVSVHSNAGRGHGGEIYTSPGQTKSDKLADVFAREFMITFPNANFRSDLTDGDLDKEAKFTILTKTRCPAILTENFFMDNYREYLQLLTNKEGRDLIAEYHIKAILKIYNHEDRTKSLYT